jgi:hypothetical protein
MQAPLTEDEYKAAIYKQAEKLRESLNNVIQENPKISKLDLFNVLVKLNPYARRADILNIIEKYRDSSSCANGN